ncbi:MAG: biopolymer transporter [Deltaproteobacteria bacterium]|nr:biopolymer transporter [Deltaproteobacteria bacterium]
MDIAALLKLFIYLIASSLLYPVMFLLVLMTLWMLICTGAFFAEWLERIRLDRCKPEELPGIILHPDKRSVFPRRVDDYMIKLRSMFEGGRKSSEIETENLLQEKSLNLSKSLEKVGLIIRIGPGLGLIGTLIPMGTGLAALGQGDMTKLSSDLVIAFTTTVVGLALGMVAFFFFTIKKRWVEEDIKNIELATDLLADHSSANQ